MNAEDPSTNKVWRDTGRLFSSFLLFFLLSASALHAVQLSDIRLQSRRIFNELDSNNTHCSDTELNAWANQWQREVSILTDWPRRQSNISTTVHVSSYALPSDFRYILEAFYNNSTEGGFTKLEELSELDLEKIYTRDWRQDVSSDPYHYFLTDYEDVGLHPAPNSANAGTNKLIVRYVAFPTTMSADADSPDLPLAYHDTAAFYIAGQCFLKMSNVGMYDRISSFYMDRVKIFKDRNESRASRVGTSDQGGPNGEPR